MSRHRLPSPLRVLGLALPLLASACAGPGQVGYLMDAATGDAEASAPPGDGQSLSLTQQAPPFGGFSPGAAPATEIFHKAQCLRLQFAG